MIGAGALGCEFVKAFSLMGVGCSSTGNVTITDNDNIEVSNLNRQFLFRKINVGDSKSHVASNVARDMNKDLNITDYKLYVAEETENLFNDEFWESLDFAVNAVDNIKARQYVDSRCVWFNKPLLESGTLGTKANTQMILPYKTQSYSDSVDPPEEGIAVCTIHLFPNLIEHCIAWGRVIFDSHFVERIQNTIAFLTDAKAFISQKKQTENIGVVREALEGIEIMLEMKQSADFSKCIAIGRELYETYFNHKIQELVYSHP
jgi:ubiquitin-activating enzyme E1